MALTQKEKELLKFFIDYGIGYIKRAKYKKKITDDTLKKAKDCGYDEDFLTKAMEHLEKEKFIIRCSPLSSRENERYVTANKSREELKTTDDEKEMERFSFQMECRATCVVLCMLPKGTTPEQAESYIMSHDMKEFLKRREIRVLDKMKRIPGKDRIMKGTVINLDA